MRLRDYQLELARKGKLMLQQNHILYLAFEMRVGKTATALHIAHLINAKKVLLLTTKINVKSHFEDAVKLADEYHYQYKLTVEHYHYKNIQKLKKDYDLVICDESQKLGMFPKPSESTKALRSITATNQVNMIFLSATPTPESYSQIYHQLWLSYFSPFNQWSSFYKWAQAGFVNIIQRRVPGHTINDYSFANKEQVDRYTKHLFLSYTQKQAEFETVKLDDQIINVSIDPNIHKLVQRVIDNRMYVFKDGKKLVCESGASLHRKIHQLYSGTVILNYDENDNPIREARWLDTTKANYISSHYRNQKIAIFYLFDAEGQMLKKAYENRWTNDPKTFNQSGKDVVFIGQFNASARGINLSSAEVLVFYNIAFSSEMYQQARQRGQEKNKKTKTKVHWIFSDDGIESNIYRRVINKQSYTLSYFERDYLS